MTKITPRNRSWRRFRAALLLSCVLATPMGLAKAATPPSSAPSVLTLGEAARLLRIGPNEVERLAAQNKIPARRIGSRWRFNRAALLAWLNGDWTITATAVPPPVSQYPSSDQAEAIPPIANLSLTPSIAQTTPEAIKSPPTGGKEEPIGEAPKERTAEEVFLRGQKILLAPGEVTMDFGQFFSRSDNQRLTAVGGGVGLATIEQKTFTTLLLGRVGVLNETELFASTTFSDQNSDVVVGSTKISATGRTEFGDVRLGVRRTLLHGGPGFPNIIGTIDGHIPTGDTSFAVGGGLAFVKSVDPAVLFASTNYRHTFSRDFSDLTRLEPKNRLDVSMGYALALNDTLTISTSVSGLYSDATSFSKATLRQQNSYSLSFGLTSWLAKGLYIEPSVSFRLGGHGNSVAFGVIVPYTF